MSKRHQASRRRSYGRRQHEIHERVDRVSEPNGWLDENELAVAFRSDFESDRGGDWTRLRGID